MRPALALAALFLSLLWLAVASGQSTVTDPAGDLVFCESGLPGEGPAISDIVSASAALDAGVFRWTVELAEPLPEQPPPGMGIRVTFGVIDPRMPLAVLGYNRMIDFQITDQYSISLVNLDEEAEQRVLPGELSIEGASVTITSPAADWNVDSPEDGRGFAWTAASSSFTDRGNVCDYLEERDVVYEVAGVAPGPGPTPPPPSWLSPVPSSPTPTPNGDVTPPATSDGDGGFPLWALVSLVAAAALLLAAGAAWGVSRYWRRS
jgi:hypothetical protein